MYTQELIDTVRANNPVLPVNASLFNFHRDPDKTSERYKETNSLGVVKAFNDLGWTVTSYKQVKAREAAKQGYKSFRATLSNPDFAPIPGVGNLTALFSDARDGTKSEEIRIGIWRLVCSNGLIVGHDIFAPIRVRHLGKDPADKILDFLGNLQPVATQVYDRVDAMRTKVLSQDEQVNFARQAAVLRFESADAVDPFQLLQVRREADKPSDLFTVYNRVQENIIRPERMVTYTTTDNRQRRARGVSNIALDTKINVGLWGIAEQFLN